MKIPPFELERYFARWEFVAPHHLSASDIEPYRLSELLDLSDEPSRLLWEDLSLAYTESPGHPLLRAEIAGLYRDLNPEDVLVFSGAEEAIFAFSQVALEPGDHAVVVWPAYSSLHQVARAAGAEITLLELKAEEGWHLDPERLRSAIRPTTRAVVMNYPHSPTGALPTRVEFQRMVEIASEAAAWFFSDEVYRGLESKLEDRLPPAVDLDPRGVSLGVLSKTFALPGLRIGWVATRDRSLIDRLAAFKDYTTICAAAPSEILALIALRARDAIWRRSTEILAANLPYLDSFFDRFREHFSWVRPRAGSVAFPRLVAELAVERFADEAREAEGVLLLPGTVFGHRGNHFRLGLGRRSLPAALDRLARFVERRLG